MNTNKLIVHNLHCVTQMVIILYFRNKTGLSEGVTELNICYSLDSGYTIYNSYTLFGIHHEEFAFLVVWLQKIDFHRLVERFNIWQWVLNISVIQCIHFKKQLNVWQFLLMIRVVLWRTFISTLFATLAGNHKNHRDWNVPVGSSASLLW